ncbi:MAG: aldo/keto reductase, partial [Candidatus Heimdallarchaeota archaeon]|nr:aldo/keto reductase [Candidatus Heimdallarchaeota archaeon]
PTRLNNLSPYPIDLHQIHSPYSFSSIKSEMNAMADLLDDGKIRSVGVSNFSANKMRKAYEVLESRGYVLASNQVKYNIMDRKIEQNGVMDLAKELGISIIAYTPLEWGILTGKLHENPKLIDSKPSFRKRYLKMKLKKSSSLIETLTLIAADHNTSVSSVALNWIISFNGDTVVCIPGASASAQVIQNVQAQNISLSKEDLNLIDDVSKKL